MILLVDNEQSVDGDSRKTTWIRMIPNVRPRRQFARARAIFSSKVNQDDALESPQKSIDVHVHSPLKSTAVHSPSSTNVHQSPLTSIVHCPLKCFAPGAELHSLPELRVSTADRLHINALVVVGQLASLLSVIMFLLLCSRCLGIYAGQLIRQRQHGRQHAGSISSGIGKRSLSLFQADDTSK